MEGLARTVRQQGWSPGGFWEKEGADRSEPQRRQQDDNWGPERILLTKPPKAARMYKRMQGKITLARTRVIFKTYEPFFSAGVCIFFVSQMGMCQFIV